MVAGNYSFRANHSHTSVDALEVFAHPPTCNRKKRDTLLPKPRTPNPPQETTLSTKNSQSPPYYRTGLVLAKLATIHDPPPHAVTGQSEENLPLRDYKLTMIVINYLLRMRISRLDAITWHGLLIRPDIPEQQRSYDPKGYAEMVEVIEIRPDASLSIAALHQCKDVHQQHHQQRYPAQDGIMEAVVKRWKN